MAEAGEIDAGILATVDFLNVEARYEPVAELGIANHENVRSILLASTKPMTQLEGARIGITEETSTSVRLLRVLLELRDGVRPDAYVRGARDEADAFLVIGNEALAQNQDPSPGFPYRYDLASEWWAWKKLPFVFALWAIRRSLPEKAKTDFASLLTQSFDQGMQQIDTIGERFAGKLGPADVLASYLRNFHYRLGPEEMKGLDEFRRLCRDNGLLQPI